MCRLTYGPSADVETVSSEGKMRSNVLLNIRISCNAAADLEIGPVRDHASHLASWSVGPCDDDVAESLHAG
jgi:hypothetical protein